MQPKKEFSDSFKQFMQVQNKHNLAEMQVDGVYIWRLIRGTLFVQQLENKNVFLKSETKNTTFLHRAKMMANSFLSFISHPSKWKELPKKTANFKTLLIDIINIIPSLLFTARLLALGSNKTVFISAFIRNIGVGHKLTQPAEDKHQNNYILLDKPKAGIFSLNRIDTRAFNMIARRFFKEKIAENLQPATAKIAKVYGLEPKTVERIVRKNLATFKAHEAAFMHLFK